MGFQKPWSFGGGALTTYTVYNPSGMQQCISNLLGKSCQGCDVNFYGNAFTWLRLYDSSLRLVVAKLATPKLKGIFPLFNSKHCRRSLNQGFGLSRCTTACGQWSYGVCIHWQRMIPDERFIVTTMVCIIDVLCIPA